MKKLKWNISYSFLSDIIKKGVLYAINRKENRKDEYNFGSAYHCLVLEPERFEKEYKVFSGTRRGKEFKGLLEEYAHSKLIPEKDLEKMQEMKKALFANEEFVKYYEICDKEVRFEKDINGHIFKGFLDLYSEFTKFGMDLKTGTTDPHEIARQVFKFNYDIQHYMYTNLADLDDFKFIFQETEYPYYSRIITLDDEWYDTGEKKTLDAYNKYINHELSTPETTVKDELLIKRAGYMTYEEESEHPAIEWWDKKDIPKGRDK